MALPFNKRDFDGMTPSVAHQDGKNMAGTLVAHMNDVRGTAVISGGSASVAVQLDAALDGNAAVANSNTADATLTTIQSVVWNGSGQLTITGNANATANTTVSYFVAGE